jgi:putative ABC transport system substrate-binding protein
LDRRRTISALAGLGALLVLSQGLAQQPGKTYRIGVLEREQAEKNPTYFNAFRQGLRDLGYIEGRNVVFEYRSSEGRDDRYPQLAAELVQLKVDLILTRGTPAVLACKAATRTIPIVMAGVGDPVADGLVASLARPGGNVTGFSASTTELSAKRLQVLQELFPATSRMGALLNLGNPNLPSQWKQLSAAAHARGVAAILFDVRSQEDLKKAFDEGARQRLDAMYVGLDTLTQANRTLIADLAVKHRLPTIAAAGDYVDAGLLASYGPSYSSLYRGAASVADRIFKGGKAGDIPVQLPYVFETAINLKTARALNISIPKDLLARADRVVN